MEKNTFSSPGDLPDPGIKLEFPALKADSLPSEPPGKPLGRKERQLVNNLFAC